MTIRRLLTSICCLLFTISTFAQTAYEPGQLIIKIKADYNAERQLQDYFSAQNWRSIKIGEPLFGYQVLKFDTEEISTEALKSTLESSANLEFVGYDHIVTFRNTPNDPLYATQWNLEKIEVEKVWDYTTGGFTANGDEIVVAVLDSGFGSHTDFGDNLWINEAELDGNFGSDDDGNGYPDDVNGWNFVNNSPNNSIASHGLSVAGVIGAEGNNGEGVTGINWNIKMLLLTIKTESQIAAAYQYTKDLRQKYNDTNGEEGAFIVVSNASFGIDKRFCDELPLWGAAYDALGEVGIINVTATTNGNDTNVDIEGDMPTTCPSDYLIAVTNTSRSDTKVPGAGIGSTHIDLGAPGGAANTGVVSLGSTNSYDESFGGTSSACPAVSGSIALLYSLNCTALADAAKAEPSKTALLMKKVILDGVDPLISLQDKTVSGGRLNAYSSMELIHGFCQESEGDLESALSEDADLGRYTLANSLLNVYPNPTNDIINVDFSIRDFGEVTLQMHHISGAFIFEEKIDVQLFDQQKWSIDVSNLASGTYFLTIQNGSNPVSRKVLIF